ncbi:MAG: AAA family ATPase [Candidatus Abawacabacteria bacterium]|nr:AAA family ATPase [Candidatus Abawacabacteria bacterium]
MPVVIITKGLPGSGKSTWAKSMQAQFPGKYIRTNKDEIRAMLHHTYRTEASEAMVAKTRNWLILEALAQGKDVIVDDTNLNPEYERTIRALVVGKATVEIKDFTHISLEECLERNKKRDRVVEEEVIRNMYERFMRDSSQSID